MAKKRGVETTLSGEPRFYSGLGSRSYIKVNGEEYMVVKVVLSQKYILGQDGILGPTEELVLEKSWGSWKVRKKGFGE